MNGKEVAVNSGYFQVSAVSGSGRTRTAQMIIEHGEPGHGDDNPTASGRPRESRPISGSNVPDSRVHRVERAAPRFRPTPI